MKVLLMALCLALLPRWADASCRLALAIALDVSGSVDQEEYRLQMTGLADALEAPDVVSTLLAAPETPVALSVFEWSSSSYQRLIQDWVLIRNEAALAMLRGRLRSWAREPAPEATGLGAALQYGHALLGQAPGCWEQTLDVSGDGRNNDWPQPEYARSTGKLAGIRINGLVIGTDPNDKGGGDINVNELSAYFRARVIQGPDAFVEVALGFEDYSDAMRRKLLRELATRPIGTLPYDSETIPQRFAVRQ